MQTYIPQPPSLKGDERAQLEQMYRYLYKMSEQLNTALAVTDKEYQIVVQTKSGSAPGSESPITPQLDAQYRELRSLIIKTADIVNQQMDKTIKQLNGKFEAISSEWGTFEQNIERKIVETAEATIDSFDYSEKIHGIEKTVLDRVKDGDVILLHDMTDSSVRAALDIVDNLKARGFRFVTASRLAVLRGRSPVPGKTYTSFPPRGN